MPDLDWLVALQEIRHLKARRDRYLDANDWPALRSLHAPDHVSHLPDGQTWNSAAEMLENTIRTHGHGRTARFASYDAEIVFETAAKARGIWPVMGADIYDETTPNRHNGWQMVFGYYHETYEKRDGRWLFTSRRFRPYLQVDSEGAAPLAGRPKGSAEDAE